MVYFKRLTFWIMYTVSGQKLPQSRRMDFSVFRHKMRKKPTLIGPVDKASLCHWLGRLAFSRGPTTAGPLSHLPTSKGTNPISETMWIFKAGNRTVSKYPSSPYRTVIKYQSSLYRQYSNINQFCTRRNPIPDNCI